MKRQGSLASHAAGMLGTKVLIYGTGLVTGIVTARLLGPHDRGLFALLFALPATLATFVKLGLAQANIYYVRRGEARPGLVAAHCLTIALVLGCGLVIVTALAQRFVLGTVMKGASSLHLAITLPLVPLILVESYFFGTLQALGRFDLFNRRQGAAAVLGLGALVLALYVLHGGLLGAVIASAVVTAGMNIWLIVTVHRVCPLPSRFDPGLARRLLGFGLKTHVQTLATHLHFRTALYMVAYFLTPTEVAFYAIATRLAELLLFVPDSVGMALFPRLAGSEGGERDALAARAARHTVLGTIVCAAGMFVLGPWFITTWYGEAYAGAVRPLLAMLPGLVTMSLFFILTRHFTSRSRQQVNIAACLTALLANVGLNAVLIPPLGPTGAALATTISYSIATLILLVVFCVETKQRPSVLLLPRLADLRLYTRMLTTRRLATGTADGR